MSTVQETPARPVTTTRLVVGLVFGFFLALALATAVSTATLCSELLSPDLAAVCFGDQYCDDVRDAIEQEAVSYTSSTKIDESVLENTFEAAAVRKDVQGYAEALLAGESYAYDDETALEELRVRVIALLRAEDKLEPKAIAGVADAYVDDIRGIYRWGVEAPAITSLVDMRADCLPTLRLVHMACWALVALLAGLLLRLHRGAEDRLVSLAEAVGGAGLLCAVVPSWLTSQGWQPQLGVDSPQAAIAFSALADRLLSRLCGGGALQLVLALLLMAAYLVVAQRNRSNNKSAGR